jgi:hypothetical protein
MQDPRKALSLASISEAITAIDIARVNGSAFMNVSVAGRAAGVASEELSSGLKRALGPLGIIVHGECLLTGFARPVR